MTKLLAKDGEGEKLDRFELIAEIASGGMATVYLARLGGVAGFQRLVAIKRLHPHLARDPEFVEMFLDEARLAARIHHPNVVPIQEVGESDRGYYLVMDYIEGDTLARILAKSQKAKTPVPYPVTVRVLLDVLAGLHAAHQMKDDHGVALELVHRDVSPQNVLVGVDGSARVVDFGVARATSRLSTTRSGQLKGKLAYMAPEQARGGTIDRRADLFSCGIVMWEALASKRLFKGDGEAETLNRVLYDEIKPPTGVRPDIPKALEDVCMKALSRDVDARYATAEEMSDALEKAARGLACVGSVRDVSECLESVMGIDLSQQRDAVRAWLARSEPNKLHGAPRSRPQVDSMVTKVDSAPSSASLPASQAPTSQVSSFSSAILQVTPSHMPAANGVSLAPPVGAQPPRKGAAWRALAALAAFVVVALVGVWGYRARARPPAVASSAPTASATTTAPEPQQAAVEPVTSAVSAASPQDAPPASAAPSASAAPARKVGIGRTNRTGPPARTPPPATAAPPPAPTPAAVPDDLSRNPYR